MMMYITLVFGSTNKTISFTFQPGSILSINRSIISISILFSMNLLLWRVYDNHSYIRRTFRQTFTYAFRDFYIRKGVLGSRVLDTIFY